MDRNGASLKSSLPLKAWGIALLPISFFSLLFFLPVFHILKEAFDYSFSPIREIFTTTRFWSIAWFTLWQAFLSTVFSIAFAFPVIYLFAKYEFKGSRILRSLVTIPFVLPTVVVGSAFTAVFTRLNLDGGALNLRHTVWAILIAHTFFNASIAIRIISTFWEGLNENPENQSRILGVSRLGTFCQITLPRLRPAIFSAATTIFLFCLTSFGIILILGGPKNSTIETEIWRQAIWRGDISTASVFALLQLLFVILLSSILIQAEKKTTSDENLANKIKRKPRKRTIVFHFTYLFSLFGLPIFILLERSLNHGNSNIFAFFTGLTKQTNVIPITPISSLWNSLHFALLAALIAVLIGILTSIVVVRGSKILSTFLNVSASIPLGVSAVTIGFGIFLAFNGPLADLRSSQWMIPILHALLGVPFVVRSVVPSMRRIPTLFYENSKLLGVNPLKSWFNIDFKLSYRSFLVGGGFSFAISLGEFGATSFLPRNPDTLTAPLVIYRLLSTPGEELRGQAMALSVILAGITSLSIFLIELARKSD
ncbi:MAG: iron ABC transporter permease [Acidimicrobiales bacterium]|jgi:thiamine transport system permease protein|nr:iron ABC transporter permease [Acidimicrobiales bacterium]